jgi:hypothetical protein
VLRNLEVSMLVIPTSATTAIILEQPMGSPMWAVFGYLAVAALFAGVFCLWEMLLAAIVGRPPSRSRWLVLLATACLFVLGVLVENLLTIDVVFNGLLETYWGFVLSPWFFVAFIPCTLALVVLRIIDAARVRPFAHLPAVAWWCAGCLLVSGYGVASLWTAGRSSSVDLYVMAAGLALVIAAVGALAIAAVLRWRRPSA